MSKLNISGESADNKAAVIVEAVSSSIKEKPADLLWDVTECALMPRLYPRKALTCKDANVVKGESLNFHCSYEVLAPQCSG